MKRAKGLVVGLAALWLAGCASTSSETDNMGDQGVMIPGGTDSAAVTVPLTDPAVQMVIDSGRVVGSPEQIAAYLRDDTVNFNYDSDRLSADDAAMLDVQAAYLTSPEGLSQALLIEGHTDERGTRTYNLALGERRAQAVKNYLVLKGVAPSRIEVVSYGFEKPLNPAHNSEGWQQNRRAVVIKEG